MISTETSEARLTSARDTVSRHVPGPHLRYQKYAIALTSDHAADEFLGAVHFRRVDQRHAERKACAHRFFFLSLRMSSLSETRRARAIVFLVRLRAGSNRPGADRQRQEQRKCYHLRDGGDQHRRW